MTLTLIHPTSYLCTRTSLYQSALALCDASRAKTASLRSSSCRRLDAFVVMQRQSAIKQHARIACIVAMVQLCLLLASLSSQTSRGARLLALRVETMKAAFTPRTR